MLKVMNIKKSFSGVPILDDVSIDAKAGELTILEGQNGAGKSTLFNILTGALTQDDGKIILDDRDLAIMPALKRAHLVGILKQDPKASTVSALSLLDNFALALLKGRTATLKTAASRAIKERAEAHLKSLGLDFYGDLNRAMDELSGGQRQMMAFAMVTINEPLLLLLDEPTAALDDKSSRLLMELVKQFLKRLQIPAIMISHDHALNRHYADTIYVLADGKVRG